MLAVALLLALIAGFGALASFAAGPALAAELRCPFSTTLTPGSQSSSSLPVLYCGEVYADSWTAKEQSDWIAFYTTQPDATVVVHYIAKTLPQNEGTKCNQPHCVNASFWDAGSSPGHPEEVARGEASGDNVEPRGLSYTFKTAGLQYLHMYPENVAEGTNYQIALIGEWSKTPPPAGNMERTPPTACPSSSMLTPGNQGDASSPVLYCGGTYTDAWNAKNESDWIAFYTTKPNANVEAQYVAGTPPQGEGTKCKQPHCVNASFWEPGSSPGNPHELAAGEASGDNQESRGLSYTFKTPGLHYLHMYPENDAEESAYHISLTGEWSQTPPPPGVTRTSTKHSGGGPTGSAKIKITSHKIKRHAVTLVAQAPSAGTITVSGSFVTGVRRKVERAERVMLRIKLSQSGLASLKRHHSKLKVKLRVSFNPSNGSGSSASVPVTFR